ncbi:MAG: hypothetical protein H6954_17565 [Chromatiaceae bacterium]|nr:hypothetical protein [Chromatiaceae bacterium]
MFPDRIFDALERLPKKTLWLLIAFVLAYLAVWNHFVQDDAFISFRYAQHLVDGHGLVWNIGEAQPVEGYTNFLWVLLIAIGLHLGIAADTWSIVLGFACGLGTLFFTYRLAHRLTGSVPLAMLAVFLLGTNYSFSAYITGGLETQLQALLVVLAFHLAFRIDDARRAGQPVTRLAFGLSLVMAAAAMTRLDSVLLAGIAWIGAAWSLWCCRGDDAGNDAAGGGAGRGRDLLALLLPGLLIGVAWFAFKLAYYGSVFPNTFFVKTGPITRETLRAGIWYVTSFHFYYGLLLPYALLVLGHRRLLGDARSRLLAAVVVLWGLYVIKIGGDFMEYRQMVPIMPLIYVLVASAFSIIGGMLARAALVAFLLAQSFIHGTSHWGYHGIEAVDELRAHVYDVGFDRSWKLVGETLHSLFGANADHADGGSEPVTIAVTAAGAIPFYSNLRTIDMIGLNDLWVAREGMPLNDFTGHGRYATLDYLLEQKVNLVIGHPTVVPLKHKYEYTAVQMFHTPYFNADYDLSNLPEAVRIVDIPISADRKVVALYLLPHPAIDRLIEEQGLRNYPPREPDAK